MKILQLFSAWGTLLLMVFLAYIFATADVRLENTLLSESLLQKQTLLLRLQDLPKRESRIRSALKELNDGLAERSLYAGDAVAVRTQVQRDVRRIAAEARIQVGSMRPLGSRRNEGELHSSAIQMSYSATHAENLEFLKLLEAAEPALRVQRLSLSVQTVSTETRAARLSINLEVAGFVQSRGNDQ